jgi:hypothetical protein
MLARRANGLRTTAERFLGGVRRSAHREEWTIEGCEASGRGEERIFVGEKAFGSGESRVSP